MRTTNNQKPATTPTISAHDKKIQKRVDKFMQSIDGLLNDERLKMYALIFLRENQYLH